MSRYKVGMLSNRTVLCSTVVLCVCSDNFANYVFMCWPSLVITYFTYHITSKLIIEKMSCYMRRKEIEENPPAK